MSVIFCLVVIFANCCLTICGTELTLSSSVRIPAYIRPEQSKGKVIEVTYKRCFAGSAKFINASVVGPTRFPDALTHKILGVYPWGFRALVQRTDRPSLGWRQQSARLRYSAVFELQDFQRFPCVNARSCTNIANVGRKCECEFGYGGELCDQVTSLSGEEPIGRNRNIRGGIILDVAYPQCQNDIAKKVMTNVESRWSDPLVATVVENFTWGFRALVERADFPEIGWGKIKAKLLWTANFDLPWNLTNPCLNGGTCSSKVGGRFCNCTRQYGGKLCETRLIHCASEPCQHGKCVELSNSYRCLCQRGFGGKQCSYKFLKGVHKTAYSPTETTKNITIAYPTCQATKAAQVDVSIRGTNVNAKIGLLRIFDWGFTCSLSYHIATVYNLSTLDIKWKAYFDPRFFDSNPCLNDGTCRNTPGSVTCTCLAKFTGRRCEIHLPPCHSNPCMNGATCINMQGYYDCICTDLYTGLNCERKPTLSARAIVPPIWEPPYGLTYNVSYRRCYSGMAMEVHATFLERSRNLMNATTLAIYPWGFQTLIQRHKPRIPLKEYRSIRYHATFNTTNYKQNPCLNRGKCTNSVEHGRLCECLSGYAGEFCEKRLLHCFPNPCFAGICTERENGYHCTCPEGSTGQNCSVEYLDGQKDVSNEEWISNQRNVTIIYDSCKKENASNVDVSLQGQIATLVNVRLQNIYNWGFTVYLTRHPGTIPWEHIQVNLTWTAYFDVRNGNPKAAVRDSLNPCLHGGKCSNTIDGHICACKKRYSGKYCETVLTFCETKPCANGGTCFDSRCHCPPGFRGPSCKSVVVHGSYHLQPEERFQTVLFNRCYNKKPKEIVGKIFRSGKQKIGFSASPIVLYENGFLIQINRPWSPTKRNFTGMEFKWTAYFVTSNFKTDMCENGGRCSVLNENDIQCSCTHSYKGKYCQTEIRNCTPTTCKNGGACIDTSMGYRCTCKNGYKGVDCSLVPINGTYVVPCPYEYSRFVPFTVTYDRCQSGQAKIVRAFVTRQSRNRWRQKAKIVNIHSWGFDGVFLRENFHLVQPAVAVHWEALFNESEYQSEVCKHNGQCVNTSNGRVCNCAPGYLGKSCEQVDYCQSNPCLNGGSCSSDGNLGFQCKCSEGFVGKRCSYDILQLKSNMTTQH